MTDDERRAEWTATKTEASEKLARLADVEVVSATDRWLSEQPDVVTQPKAFNQWLARQPDDGSGPMQPAVEILPPEKREPQQPPPLPSRTFTDAEIARMFANVQKGIDDALEARQRRDDLLRDAIGDALGEVRGQLRDELSKVSEQVGNLRADIEIAKAHDTDRGDVTVLPMPRGRHG